ncbi:unnamed protein product [Gongylonema pulchrum]|uniref:EB domain-containing protein n=1 Tax=Gongylonema pulchrum TaxID=637853 RepID=A0A183E777_9BILA|nr:unnamed protein product [Gongylonema pulchrum]
MLMQSACIVCNKHIISAAGPNRAFCYLVKCPFGQQMLTLGKYMPVICTPDNSIEDDVCPYGYECLRSITDFAQGLSQPNYVCCRAAV